MNDTTDFHLKAPASSEDERERLKNEYKKIAEFFGASSAVAVEGQNGCIFHVEFEDAEAFGAFADYLKAQGVQGLNVKKSEDDSVN